MSRHKKGTVSLTKTRKIIKEMHIVLLNLKSDQEALHAYNKKLNTLKLGDLEKGIIEAVKLLIADNAEVNITNITWLAPYHGCTKAQVTNTVHRLIKKKILKVDQKGDSKTPTTYTFA